jgi:exodeoxyribonuclease V gamma subunit
MLEKLADKLIKEMDKPQTGTKASLFQKEIVVSQSKGMEKWLSLRIAEKAGISANIRFPFPKTFIYDELFSPVLDLPEKPIAFQPEIMAWKIMGALPDLISKDRTGDFDSPKSYLSVSKDSSGKSYDKLKLYQLSNRIANVFDQYMVYRPEMLLCGWKNDGFGKVPNTSKAEWDKRAKWQKTLFEIISEGSESLMPSKLYFDFISRLNPEDSKDFKSVKFPELPPRIFVFGVSVMPPLFLDVFKALSNKIDVHFFYMNPCMHYWADLESEDSAMRKSLAKGKSKEELHYDEINPILASMGKYGKDFLAVVTEKLGDSEGDNIPEPSGKRDLLSMLHDNIRTLDPPPKQLDGKTRLNIQFHACYNPMREVEVLYDNLLSIIESEKVAPKDIIVVTPDIGKYAPFIRAVFETPENQKGYEARLKIPYSVADRTMSAESPVFKAFTGILDITKNRYAASAVMDILDTDGVRENFDLGNSEVSQLRTWLSDCKISWGIDAEYRKSIDLPAFGEGSWRTGLDRLLLGFALGTEENDESFKLQGKSSNEETRIFPYEKIEEGDAIVLGRLAEFADRIFEAGAQLSTERTLSEWADFLMSLTETFIKSKSDNKKQIGQLKGYVRRLKKIQDICGYDEKLPLDVVKSYLVENFEQEKTEGGFMRYGVTFCELLPMRSIPFKVICMLGMNDNDFPRQTKRPGFDLTLGDYRKCDRELRFEDRYLFLEAVLSAREYLYVSYTGMSMDDNKELPPSVLVSDLRDYLTNRFHCNKEDILTKHPLQAFSYSNYLKGRIPKIFSYSKNNYEAAAELLRSGDRKSVHVLWPCDLKIPLMEESKLLRLETLIKFFKAPAENFLKGRLNLRLEGEDDAQLDEKELLKLNHLEIYCMNQDIMAARISKDKNRALSDFEVGGNFHRDMKAKGLLPAEPFASGMYKDIFAGSMIFAESFKDLTSGYDPQEPVQLDIPLDGGIRLTGNLCNLYARNDETRQVLHFLVNDSPKYHITAWLSHLAANANGINAETIMLIKDDKGISRYIFHKLDKSIALQELNTLTALFKEGLAYPLPFFPKSSGTFVDNLGKGVEIALVKAAETYEPAEYSKGPRGESADNYIRYCFSESLFSADEYASHRADFINRSMAILGPMIKVRKPYADPAKKKKK